MWILLARYRARSSYFRPTDRQIDRLDQVYTHRQVRGQRQIRLDIQTDRQIRQTDRLDRQTIQVGRQIEIDRLDQIDWIDYIDIWTERLDRQTDYIILNRQTDQINRLYRQIDRQRQIYQIRQIYGQRQIRQTDRLDYIRQTERLDRQTIQVGRQIDRDRLDQIDIWTEIDQIRQIYGQRQIRQTDQIILDRQIRQIDYIGRQIDIDRYIDRLDIWTEMDQIERQIRLYQTDRLDSWMDRDRLDLIDRQIDQIRQVGGWTNGRWTVVWMNGLKDLQIMCGRAEQTSPCSRLPCRTVAVKFPLACVPSRRQSCWLFEQQSVLLRDRRNKRGKDPCRRGDHHTCAWFQLSCVLLAEFTAMSLGFIQRLPVRQDRG